MNNTNRISGMSALAWALLALMGFATVLILAPIRNYDNYDIQAGLRALNEQPALVIGGQIAFGWAGVVLVLMALAFYDWLPAESRLGIATWRARVLPQWSALLLAISIPFGAASVVVGYLLVSGKSEVTSKSMQ